MKNNSNLEIERKWILNPIFALGFLKKERGVVAWVEQAYLPFPFLEVRILHRTLIGKHSQKFILTIKKKTNHPYVRKEWEWEISQKWGNRLLRFFPYRLSKAEHMYGEEKINIYRTEDWDNVFIFEKEFASVEQAVDFHRGFSRYGTLLTDAYDVSETPTNLFSNKNIAKRGKIVDYVEFRAAKELGSLEALTNWGKHGKMLL
jgi:hypothetical protein